MDHPGVTALVAAEDVEPQIKAAAGPSQQGPDPAVTAPGRALCAQLAQPPAQLPLNTFCFSISHPCWMKAVTITGPWVVITNLTNLSALNLPFLHNFKYYFYTFILL